VLCIKGKPGAGKSTLMKHVLEYCKDTFPNDVVVAYFFNARGGYLEKSPLGMLRSITYQLIKGNDTLFDQFLARFRDKHIISQGREWEWHQRDLRAFITSVIKGWKAKSLLLFVDALDECNEADMQDVVEFLESLSIIAVRSGVTLRICLSRRHHPPLRIAKSLELIAENNENHRKDIATYIRAKLAIRDADIEDEVEGKADGIFMWVVLVVRLLNKASLKVRGKRKAMQDALDQIPGELEEVFRMLLNKDDEDIAETILMFQLVLFAGQPLMPEELYAAVEAGDTGSWSQKRDIDYGSIPESIENVSKGLIEIRRGVRETVQFIHLSVKDFLLRNNRLQTLDQALEPNPVTASHSRLWACCWSHIRQLSSTGTEWPEEWPDELPDELPEEWPGEWEFFTDRKLYFRYPFLEYAARYMFYHAEKTLDEGTVGKAGVKINKWLRDGTSWLQWWISSRPGFQEETGGGLLYILSLLGHGSLLKCMLADNGEKTAAAAEVNAQGGQYGNALQAAASALRGENLESVELLLKAGAEVNAQGGYYGNALQAASVVWGAKRQTVELLLKAGADVNAQGGHFGNALQAASVEGELDIVKLLLKAGAEVNAQGGYYGNALQAASAAREGKRQTVELLLKAGAEVNAQGGFYGNALQAASSAGNREVVELLLNAGAEVNAQGGKYDNALQAASAKGEKEIVKLLLKAGAEVSAQGGRYGNALRAALERGHEEIVPLLLKANVEVNALGGPFGDALQFASSLGYGEHVKLLLKAGAEVNAQGDYYGNALQAASSGKHWDLVKLLREAGATETVQHSESLVIDAGGADAEAASFDKRE